MTIDPYASIAEWYDLEHDRLSDDIECYTSLISQRFGTRAQVLEIGSGTGRTAAALAIAGYSVTGAEPSASMRARCAERLGQLPQTVARRVAVHEGSASAPNIPADRQFDIVLLGLNVIAHLTSHEARRHALQLAARHLTPHGVLLLDLDIQGMQRLRSMPGQMLWQGTWQRTSSDEMVTHLVVAAPGPDPHVFEVVHFYDVHAPGGNLRRWIARMDLAQLSKGEVSLLLEMTGFSVEAVYGTHALDDYDEHSPRAIFVARLNP